MKLLVLLAGLPAAEETAKTPIIVLIMADITDSCTPAIAVGVWLPRWTSIRFPSVSAS